MDHIATYRDQTRQQVQIAYLTLRVPTLTRAEAFALENDLSTLILETEEDLLGTRTCSDRPFRLACGERRAILKRIADGLAWRFLGFDEHFLRVCAMGQVVGYMAGKAGHGPERRALKALSSLPQVQFAVQNDITNILRVGDITILLENEEIIPIEIKSSETGKSSKRAQRQARRYREFLTYLETGTSKGLSLFGSGEPVRVVEIEGEDQRYWPELEQVITRTLTAGSAWQVLDEGVAIMGYVEATNDDGLEDAVRSTLADAGWTALSPRSLRIAALRRHLDPLDNDILRYVIPVTAFDIAPSAGVAFLRGEVEVSVFVNMNTVIDLLAKSGYGAEISSVGRLEIHAPSGWRTIGMRIAEKPWSDLLYGLKRLPAFVNDLVLGLVEAEKNYDKLISGHIGVAHGNDVQERHAE